MFNPLTYKPFCTYYSFYAFGQLYQLGNWVESSVDIKNVYTLAAADGNERAVMISNISGADVEITTDFSDNMEIYAIDEKRHFILTDLAADSFTLPNNTVYFIKNKA